MELKTMCSQLLTCLGHILYNFYVSLACKSKGIQDFFLLFLFFSFETSDVPINIFFIEFLTPCMISYGDIYIFKQMRVDFTA